MENPFKTLYDSIEDFILQSATFKKLATTFYNRGGGKSSQKISYERQGADMRTKEIKDWQTAVMAATDPENPRRELLYFIYQSLLRDDDLQATIENRVLPLQMASYKIVDKKTGEENKEAMELLERTWFQELRKMSVMSQLQGNLLVALGDKLNPKTMEIEEVFEIPQCNYVAQSGVIVEKPYDQRGISYREGGMGTYYYQFGKDWDLGLLNVLAIPIFAKKLGFGSWISYIDQFGVPFMFIVTERMDEGRRDQLFEMMNEMRSGRIAVLQGNERVDFGKEASSSTTNAFEPFMEKCHNIITRLILGQTGTTNNEAYEGTSKIHEKVEKYRHEADKLLFMYAFNKDIIPRLVKISPVYSVFEDCKLVWDDHETLSLKDYIDAIKSLAYTFDFDPEEVAAMTGLPIVAVKQVTNQGIQSGGNLKDNGKNKGNGTKPNPDDDDDPDGNNDPDGKGTSKKKEGTKAESLIQEIDMLYYEGEETPEAAVSFPLLQKVRERILKRFRSEEFNYKKDIDPDLFGHTFETLDKGLRDTFGEPAWGTPDREFLEYASKNVAIFSGFKTLQQQKELHNLLFDESGKMKSFDQFRRETMSVLDKYNQNWLKTEYDTLVARARFASDWKKFEKNKDLYPNLKWLPSSSIDKRDSHKLFYNRVWPIDDPFWDTNYPGNLWNCKCGIKSTSEGAVPAKNHNHSKPSPGLEKNPGKTGVMFTKEHPYIKNASKGDKETVKEFTDPIVTKNVNDLKDVQDVLDKYLDKYPEDANGKKITLGTFSRKLDKSGYTPFETENDTIRINTYKIYDGKYSAKDLLFSAIQKMPKGQKNTFDEENMLKDLYHEILHIKAKGRSHLNREGRLDYKRFAMETINEFVAQNEYPQFITRLGGKVSHFSKMKDKSATYKNRLARLRELLYMGRIKEKEAYEFLAPKLMTEKYENLDEVLHQFLKERLKFDEDLDNFYELMQYGSMTKWNEFIKKIKK